MSVNSVYRKNNPVLFIILYWCGYNTAQYGAAISPHQRVAKSQDMNHHARDCCNPNWSKYFLERLETIFLPVRLMKALL